MNERNNLETHSNVFTNSASPFHGRLAQKAEAVLVIEPALIKQKLTQKRSSGSFYIRNVGDQEERYRATAVHFTVGEKGGLQVIPPDDHSLAKWIKFNPTEFVLPPKSSRMVRYSIIPQGKLKEREYWGAIQFMPLKGQKVTSKDKAGRDFSLEVMSIALVPIYGTVAGTKFSGQLTSVAAKQEKDKVAITFLVKNTNEGVLRLSGVCQFVDDNGKMAKEVALKRVVVFPQTTRLTNLDFPEKLAAGKYTVRIILNNKEEKVSLTGETGFIYEQK